MRNVQGTGTHSCCWIATWWIERMKTFAGANLHCKQCPHLGQHCHLPETHLWCSGVRTQHWMPCLNIVPNIECNPSGKASPWCHQGQASNLPRLDGKNCFFLFYDKKAHRRAKRKFQAMSRSIKWKWQMQIRWHNEENKYMKPCSRHLSYSMCFCLMLSCLYIYNKFY